MTIYNINLGIGWASSEVNTQAYRAGVFHKSVSKFYLYRYDFSR